MQGAHGGEGSALVLGGGGAFGIVQAAYVQAAYELGFRPQYVVGTSVGSLNGAWIALHPNEPQRLLEIWRTLHRRSVLKSSPLKIALRAARRTGGIFRNDLVTGLIEDHIKNAGFSDTVLPLRVVATNLSRGYKHVFGSGLLGPAIMASTAIPGLFDPVQLGGELYVDGCLTASVDLATAVEMGASEILAIDLTPKRDAATPRTSAGVLRHSLSILSNATTSAMEELARQLMPTRVIRPNLDRHTAWTIVADDDEVELALAEARADLATVLDRDGHVLRGAPGISPSAAPALSQAARGRLPFKLRLRDLPAG